jgi:hypothetical protein
MNGAVFRSMIDFHINSTPESSGVFAALNEEFNLSFESM